MLENMKQENEQKRAKYQADLDKIEADLAAVEAKHGPAGDEPEAPANS